jgi:regulator of protease activity HflC (stomatin/prohibitin superfamily)
MSVPLMSAAVVQMAGRPERIPLRTAATPPGVAAAATGTKTMWNGYTITLAVIVGLTIVYTFAGIRVAQEYQRAVVFRLGRFHSVRGPGLYWNMPIFEWQRKVDMRTATVNVEPQESITKDSVTVKVNAVLWYRVTEPYKAILEVADFRAAVYQVALTSLRNIIGQHVLDEVLKERDQINEKLKAIVDRATEPWGVSIEAVEMKDVEIPQSMQRAMAREAEAIREKRARIIKAEAEQEASLKLAEASRVITTNPLGLELRRMQMISEVGAEQNTTTIIMMPSEFVTLAQGLSKHFAPNKPMPADMANGVTG